LRLGLLLGVQKPVIVFHRELGVNGKPDPLVAIIASARQDDGVFDPFAAVSGRYVGSVLVRSEHLFEHGSKLDLTPGAAGLHVG